MSNALKKLVNRSVAISVGEPWDFVSDAGKNVLNGFVSLVSDENETEWLKCDVSPFSLEKHSVKSVVAVHRYAKQTFSVLMTGEKVTVNLLFEPSGKNLDSSQIRDALQTQVGVSFLVGSVQLD